jgi:hypothetical protein
VYTSKQLTLLALTDPCEALQIVFAGLSGDAEKEDFDLEQFWSECYPELEDFSDGKEHYLGLTYQLVHQEGGHEGGGESVDRVYALKDFVSGDVHAFIRQTGYYYSHNGTEWDDGLNQVYAREVMITIYEDNPHV